MRLLFYLFCLFFTSGLHPQERLYIDFDESIHRGYTDKEFEQHLDQKPQKAYLPILRDLYLRNHPLLKQPIRAIPRIIHQIWLGSPLPERYRQLQQTWKTLHPDWEYKLWTEEDLDNFSLVNQNAFDESRNYGEKANIWRYEILDRFGGLYIDTDFQALRPFDPIHDLYEFYAGLATVDRITLINNGLIASIPGHPILKACIRSIRQKKTYGHGQYGRNGTIFFGHTIMQTILDNPGMNVLIFPPTYFYPYPGKKAVHALEEYIIESSFAVHFWDMSWARRPQ